MATYRRSLVISILFAVFGGPGIVLVYLPLWITHFRIPAGEPLWQMLVAVVLIAPGWCRVSSRRGVLSSRAAGR